MGLFDEDEDEGTQITGPKGLLGNGLPATVAHDTATVVVKAPVGTTLDSIPAPYKPMGDGALSDQEAKDFEACKAGMDNLQKAFWIAGKSLETMKTANLHRNSEYPNFAEFVWVHWEVSESQAHRLMDEWRMGQALAGLGWRPREAQVRELTSVAKQAGEPAAVALYDAVARVVPRVTAKILNGVVRQLPPLSPNTDPASIRTIVRQVIGSQRTDEVEVHDITSLNQNSPIGESDGEASDDKGEAATSADVERLVTTLARLSEAAKAVNRAVVRRALEDHPDTAAALIRDIDQTLNKIGRAVAVRPAAASTP
jgi:hypothetical protein